MSRTILSPTLTLLGGTALAAVLLAGCTATAEAGASATPTASPASSVTTAAPSPDTQTPTNDVALSLVRDYLTAIQSESYADAYALLTDESATLVGSAEQFAESASSGLVRPAEAAGYLGDEGSLDAGEGPVPGSVLVTAVRDRVADAWLVRSTDGSVGIDDAGVPPTGASPYEWVNPASGPEDVRDIVPVADTEPASILFRTPEDAEGPSLVGSPGQLTAYVGTVEVPASMAAADNQRRWSIPLDTTPPSAETQALTVVWEVTPGSGQWRTSTTPLFLAPGA
jgi:hypothetical protein